MNRSDFQQLAETRLKETKVLLDAGCYEGAYYLAGYIVECALKACVAKNIKQYEFPDKSLIKEINKLYGHKASELLGLAGLKVEFEDQMQANKALEVNWAIIERWSSEARYQVQVSEKEARDLLAAIIDQNGILEWLKTRW